MFPISLSLKRIAFAVLLFETVFCQGQSLSDVQRLHYNDFNWSVAIPKGFEKLPDTLLTKLQNKGAAVIEHSYGKKVDNQAKTIFVFQSGQYNSFESNYQPFDPSRDGDYMETFKMVKGIVYGSLKANLPKARFDSSYSREVIGGKEFKVFNLVAYINPQMTVHVRMYGRLFGKKEFSVNIMYMDPAKGKALLEAWRGSSFGN